MVKYSGLDRVLQALADPTRRAIVERLVAGPASVSQLAQPFSMSLAAVLQHVGVLEDAGVVRTEKTGRVRTCLVAPEALRAVESWVVAQRGVWERRLDRLAADLGEGDLAASNEREDLR